MAGGFRRAVLMWVMFGLTGCTTPGTRTPDISERLTLAEKRAQEALHVQRVVEYQTRLEQISAPLLQAALPFCKDRQTGYLGLRVDNIDAWTGDYQVIARDTLHLDHALKVTMIIPDSPAEMAGVSVGDMVLSVNGRTTIGGPGAIQDFNQLIRGALQEDNVRAVLLQIYRQGRTLELRLHPEPTCDYPVYVVMNNAINAFATGEVIGVTSGLMRFAENDDEIALVVAHEIAHNGRKHIEAKVHNAQLASVFDLIAAAYGVNTQGVFTRMGANSFSKDFEREADYLGLYILARADVPLDGLDSFWRRMAAEDPLNNRESMFRTHPVSAERTLALDRTIAEIGEKRAAGLPLLPELKE